MDQQEQPFGRAAYFGIFFLTLGTIMFEILLTRIFSVTMWYHFAFMAISVALFGMTVGAIVVYLRPSTFTTARAPQLLSASSLACALAVTASFLIYLQIPYGAGKKTNDHLTLALIFAVISVPFVFSGIAVTLALTKFPSQVSKIYGVDLAGAALGCLLVIGLLETSDGPTAVIAVSALMAVAACCFAVGVPGGIGHGLRGASALTAAAVAGFCLYNTTLVWKQQGLVRLQWVKGEREEALPDDVYHYEKWNSFSRIRVVGQPGEKGDPWGWALSVNLPKHDEGMEQYALLIDASAATGVTKWDGQDLDKIDYLKWDLTNLVHHFRQDADVLVVGVGGGRDVLSAMAFGQNHVTGVELNHNIIDIITNREILGGVTSLANHESDPRYDIVVDEARSYIARSDKKYDIIMASLIDTWAATAAGAFVMSENSLYTAEAWDLFLDRLKPGGIVSFSRWYHDPAPLEVYRMLSMAVEVLGKRGVKEIRRHVIIMRRMIYDGAGVGTFLLSAEPFSDEDLRIVDMAAGKFAFERVLTPDFAIDENFEAIASAPDREAFLRDFPINIAPPTDNNPFFFNMLRLKDYFRKSIIAGGDGRVTLLDDLYMSDALVQGIRVLGRLLITVLVLAAACIFLPLLLTSKRGSLRGSLPYMLYFCGIGTGFMLVEIAEMQRLIVFLGHPVYALTVVLFVFLFFSGVGSYFTNSIGPERLARGGAIRICILVAILALGSFLTPAMVASFAGATTPVRILLSVLLLAPMAFFMGMCFPIGMKAANIARGELSPWLWGVNGATSVVASVLAVALSMTHGINTTFGAGFCAYLVTLASFLYLSKRGFQ